MQINCVRIAINSSGDRHLNVYWLTDRININLKDNSCLEYDVEHYLPPKIELSTRKQSSKYFVFFCNNGIVTLTYLKR